MKYNAENSLQKYTENWNVRVCVRPKKSLQLTVWTLNKSATICQIWSILETKTMKKIVCFLGDLKQTKIAFEISWPLNSHFENVTWQIHRPLVRRQCVFLEFSHLLSNLLWYKMPKRCRKLLQFGPYAFST